MRGKWQHRLNMRQGLDAPPATRCIACSAAPQHARNQATMHAPSHHPSLAAHLPILLLDTSTLRTARQRVGGWATVQNAGPRHTRQSQTDPHQQAAAAALHAMPAPVAPRYATSCTQCTAGDVQRSPSCAALPAAPPSITRRTHHRPSKRRHAGWPHLPHAVARLINLRIHRGAKRSH